MLISQGGFYNVGKKKIGIQSICLEEDAAKLLVSMCSKKDGSTGPYLKKI